MFLSERLTCTVEPQGRADDAGIVDRIVKTFLVLLEAVRDAVESLWGRMVSEKEERLQCSVLEISTLRECFVSRQTDGTQMMSSNLSCFTQILAIQIL
jgi:hypothetical protein